MNNTTWKFLIKTVPFLKKTIKYKNHYKTETKIIVSNLTLIYLSNNFKSFYYVLKNKIKKVNYILEIYDIILNKKIDNFVQNKSLYLFIDFSRKQVYTTKSTTDFKTLYTISNGVFSKKLNSDVKIIKTHFFLKNEFLLFYLTKILNLNSKKKTILYLKGNTYDTHNFFQKLERIKLIDLFNRIILNFSSNYNLNKKKRIRSIKKRLKKSFLKNENRIIHNFLKIY